LTRASVLSADMLFATLDPTLRAVALPHGARIILSDTVGFISDLPTMLIAAFRATLEEVIEADVILHVRDISHEDAESQLRDVEKILHELGIEAREDDDNRRTMIEVWNKIDRLDHAARERLANIAERRKSGDRPVLVSATTGEGLDQLAQAVETRLAAHREVIDLHLDPSDGAGLSWLYRHTEVLQKSVDENGVIAVTVRADPDKAARLRARFSDRTAGARRL
jgi:GTP-binding protein HflX